MNPGAINYIWSTDTQYPGAYDLRMVSLLLSYLLCHGRFIGHHREIHITRVASPWVASWEVLPGRLRSLGKWNSSALSGNATAAALIVVTHWTRSPPIGHWLWRLLVTASEAQLLVTVGNVYSPPLQQWCISYRHMRLAWTKVGYPWESVVVVCIIYPCWLTLCFLYNRHVLFLPAVALVNIPLWIPGRS